MSKDVERMNLQNSEGLIPLPTPLEIVIRHNIRFLRELSVRASDLECELSCGDGAKPDGGIRPKYARKPEERSLVRIALVEAPKLSD